VLAPGAHSACWWDLIEPCREFYGVYALPALAVGRRLSRAPALRGASWKLALHRRFYSISIANDSPFNSILVILKEPSVATLNITDVSAAGLVSLASL
jgi:hypothetical protein